MPCPPVWPANACVIASPPLIKDSKGFVRISNFLTPPDADGTYHVMVCQASIHMSRAHEADSCSIRNFWRPY